MQLGNWRSTAGNGLLLKPLQLVGLFLGKINDYCISKVILIQNMIVCQFHLVWICFTITVSLEIFSLYKLSGLWPIVRERGMLILLVMLKLCIPYFAIGICVWLHCIEQLLFWTLSKWVHYIYFANSKKIYCNTCISTHGNFLYHSSSQSARKKMYNQ